VRVIVLVLVVCAVSKGTVVLSEPCPFGGGVTPTFLNLWHSMEVSNWRHDLAAVSQEESLAPLGQPGWTQSGCSSEMKYLNHDSEPCKTQLYCINVQQANKTTLSLHRSSSAAFRTETWHLKGCTLNFKDWKSSRIYRKIEMKEIKFFLEWLKVYLSWKTI